MRFRYHRGERGDMTVEENNVLNFIRTDYPLTVTAPGGAITSGTKAMYEVEFREGRDEWFIGWATPNFKSEEEGGGRGFVGLCDESYSFGSSLGMKFHNNVVGTEWGTSVYFPTTKVLGVAADLQTGTLLYAWNGNWEDKNMGMAFEGLPLDVILFPVISCFYGHGEIKVGQIKVNLGAHEFQFNPPDTSYRSIDDAM